MSVVWKSEITSEMTDGLLSPEELEDLQDSLNEAVQQVCDFFGVNNGK